MTSRKHAQREPSGSLSLLELFNILLRRRRWLLGMPLAVAALVLVVSLVLPRTYTVDVSFMPQSAGGQLARFSGLAAQLGISLPAGDVDTGPEFYADLLDSRSLLEAAVRTRYEVGGGQQPEGAHAPEGGRATVGSRGGGVDLVRLLGFRDDDPEKATERAIEDLQDRLHVSTDRETGVVELSVTMKTAAAAEQVARRLIELVDTFDLESRQSRAAAEREFLEGRVSAARADLVATEDSLKSFLEANRRYENSPELRFEFERLQHRLDLQRQLYTTLTESLEQAKIEAVRNTPVITIVQPPYRPARPDSRHLGLRAVLGLLVGGMVGLLGAVGREFFDESRRGDPGEYGEFVHLRAEARHDLRSLAKAPKRLFGSSAPDR